ncbi:MAG: hypothetical protein ACLFR6_06340 [Salinarchaeum sp.]
MAQNTDATDAQYNSFPEALMAEELNNAGISSPDGERVIVHISPSDLDRADELAAEFGLERVDDELDRRTYAPAN